MAPPKCRPFFLLSSPNDPITQRFKTELCRIVTLWQTISEPGAITFGLPTIQESAYQKTRTALIRSNRLHCAYEPTSIQIRISEEFLAKNPKAFRTIEQLLMEAVWRQGKPAEQDKGIEEAFLHLLPHSTTVAFGELGPRDAGAWQHRLLVAGATPNRLHLLETSMLPVDTLVDECGEARIG